MGFANLRIFRKTITAGVYVRFPNDSCRNSLTFVSFTQIAFYSRAGLLYTCPHGKATPKWCPSCSPTANVKWTRVTLKTVRPYIRPAGKATAISSNYYWNEVPGQITPAIR